MKVPLALALSLAAASAAAAQRPPAAPPVDDRRFADPYRVNDYATLYRMAEAGIPVVLYVGVPDAPVGRYETYWVAPGGFRGLADGIYDCRRQADGRVTMTRRPPPPTAPPVAFPVQSYIPPVCVGGT